MPPQRIALPPSIEYVILDDDERRRLEDYFGGSIPTRLVDAGGWWDYCSYPAMLP